MFVQNVDNAIVHFPLYESEASKVIQSFEQSPYGKGKEIIVDTSVRNSWQLDSNGFEVTFILYCLF